MKISEASDHVLGATQLQHAPAYFVGTGFHPVDNGRERYAISEEFVRIKLHLILAHKAANRGHFGHARHSFELVAKMPVLKTSQVGKAVFATVIDQRIFVDPTGTRS